MALGSKFCAQVIRELTARAPWAAFEFLHPARERPVAGDNPVTIFLDLGAGYFRQSLDLRDIVVAKENDRYVALVLLTTLDLLAGAAKMLRKSLRAERSASNSLLLTTVGSGVEDDSEE